MLEELLPTHSANLPPPSTSSTMSEQALILIVEDHPQNDQCTLLSIRSF